MHDLAHARPAGGDGGREPRDATGAVADPGGKPPAAAVDHQPVVDDPVEDREIDVPATEQEHGAAAGEFRAAAPEQGGERRGGGPFDHGLFQFEQPQHGERELRLIDGHDLVDQRGRKQKRQLTHPAHRQAVRERRVDRYLGRPTGGERRAETRRGGRLHGHDADVGPQGLGSDRHARQQPGPTGRNHDRGGVGHVFQNLQRHRPLPRDHPRVVEAVDPIEAVAIGDRGGPPTGIVEGLPLEDHPGPEPPARRHFHQGCKSGHHHRHGDAEEFAVVGKAQGMVAGRCGHDAPRLRGVVEHHQRVARPALLEAARPLEEIELAEDVGPGRLRKRDAPRAGRPQHAACDPGLRGEDVVEGDCRPHPSPTRAGR